MNTKRRYLDSFLAVVCLLRMATGCGAGSSPTDAALSVDSSTLHVDAASHADAASFIDAASPFDAATFVDAAMHPPDMSTLPPDMAMHSPDMSMPTPDMAMHPPDMAMHSPDMTMHPPPPPPDMAMHPPPPPPDMAMHPPDLAMHVDMAAHDASVVVDASSPVDLATSGPMTRTLTGLTTPNKTIVTPYGGSCSLLTRDTSSCMSARTALGLSGNWLQFSCNVVLGLANAAGVSVTSLASATYVTVTMVDLPDYKSTYFPTTGSYSFSANGVTVTGNYSDMYSAYATTFPDPSYIAQQSYTLEIPITPTAASPKSQNANGYIAVAINGVAILSSIAGATDSIFTEAGSFDQCQGHPNNQGGGFYHYHSEPYSISHDDNALIGIMRDGYFIYGRKDYDGTYPGSTAALLTAGSSSNIYVYGGHAGPDPLTNTGTAFHYHLTEWPGCVAQTGHTVSPTNGQTNDTFNTPSGTTCAGGTISDAWFMIGHGNGGVYPSVPSGLAGQAPSQTVTGARYFYGVPGGCVGSGC